MTAAIPPLRRLVLITLLVNASAMLSPIIDSGDAVIYASIARHLVLSHDWARLVLDGHDWLDKPHLPFWMTALSFSVGGVSALTYILPGFIFHLLGAYYAYRLAALLYDERTALMAVLIYVSIFSLMDSSIEIKAEAYLGPEILAACYHWLRLDRRWGIIPLLLGALFTGMAIMTKGIFVLLTIFSGLVCSWVYRRRWSEFLSVKWLAAVTLSLAFAAPELVALHLQFEHGESPLRFFFWDSQFGRFFNTGPIQNHNGYPLYFVLVFLWAFLPWTLVGLAAIYDQLRKVQEAAASDRSAFVFLAGMFSCTFLLFSATKFQMAYYMDIILPFPAILTARYLGRATIRKPLFIAQMGLIAIIASTAIGLSIYVMNFALLATMAALGVGLVAYAYATKGAASNHRVIAYSVLAINMLYVFSVCLSYLAFSRFSIPYNAARFFGRDSAVPIYVYQMPEVARELALYSRAPAYELDTPESLAQIQAGSYLIVRDEQAAQLPLDASRFEQLVRKELVVHKTGTLNKLLRLAKGTWPLEATDFFRSAPTPDGRRVMASPRGFEPRFSP